MNPLLMEKKPVKTQQFDLNSLPVANQLIAVSAFWFVHAFQIVAYCSELQDIISQGDSKAENTWVSLRAWCL